MEAEYGELASGLIGQGRLPEPQAIFDRAVEILKAASLEKKGPLAGKKVLVTAGPTREAIDPVRYISNHSTGTMGYELARSAARLGADVVLVSGPTSLETPKDVRRIDVVTAAEMHHAVKEHVDANIVIMVAAVADYAAVNVSTSKIKKDGLNRTLGLKPTVDILASLGASKSPGQLLVGFALETDNLVANATEKLNRKNLDWIILNNPKEEGAGFGTGTNRVTLLSKEGKVVELPKMPKDEVAEAILELVS